MIKIVLAIVLLSAIFGGGYFYGYNNGKIDAASNTDVRSIESQAVKYHSKLRSLESSYKDKDGNVIIPKLEWDKMKSEQIK